MNKGDLKREFAEARTKNKEVNLSVCQCLFEGTYLRAETPAKLLLASLVRAP
jgi:hypothetical protein